MDISTPPKSSSRHVKEIQALCPFPSLDLVLSSPPKRTPPPPSPTTKTCHQLQELLLLSPSPLRRSRTRLSERLELNNEEGILEANGSKRRCKNRGGQLGLLGSPRNGRRSRRRVEQEVREEKEIVEEVVKVRKRRHSGRAKKEKLSVVQSSSSSLISDEEVVNLDWSNQLVTDLVMWRDVSKSSLWFGFGTVCFLSSYFSKGISFSIFSAISQLGLLFLGLSFFSNTMCQRNNEDKPRKFKLKEYDILRAARVILPTVNFAISNTRELFSGEPSMTLKLAPALLVGAQYGHLITLWRLCVLGFFISFTVPKLYSTHAVQINKQAENLRWWVMEIWGACSHKRIVALSAVTAFWNLSSLKTRIFAAFILLVIVRYQRQHTPEHQEGEGEEKGEGERLHQQTLFVPEGGEKKKKRKQEEQKQEEQALVVIEGLKQKK